jgi:hypothetical protein
MSGKSLDDTSFLDRVSPALARPFQSGFSDAMDQIFLLAALLLVVAFVLFMLLPQVPLRAQSGMAARAAAAAPPPPPASARAGAPTTIPAHAEPALLAAAGSIPEPHLVSAATSGRTTPVSEEEPRRPEPIDRPDGPAASGRGGGPAVSGRSGGPAASGRGAGPAVGGRGPGAVVSGRVDGPDGLPLAGATVTVAEFAGGAVAHTATGPDGEFRLPLPTGGAFLLICVADDHQPAAVLVNAGVGEVRRVLALAGAGRIEGRITDRQNRPLAGASVTLTDLGGTVVATAATDADGRYRLSGLDQADYMLTATAEHARPATRIISAGRSRQADLELAVGTTLTGRVRAARSGRPVPEASVMAVDAAGEVAGATTTDRDGRYELRDLPPGTYTVVASGYAPVASRVELSGEHADHDIVLGAPPAYATADSAQDAASA